LCKAAQQSEEREPQDGDLQGAHAPKPVRVLRRSAMSRVSAASTRLLCWISV
jgi:hypothetical protein